MAGQGDGHRRAAGIDPDSQAAQALAHIRQQIGLQVAATGHGGPFAAHQAGIGRQDPLAIQTFADVRIGRACRRLCVLAQLLFLGRSPPVGIGAAHRQPLTGALVADLDLADTDIPLAGPHRVHAPRQAAEQRVAHADGGVAPVVVIAQVFGDQFVVAPDIGAAEHFPAAFAVALVLGRIAGLQPGIAGRAALAVAGHLQGLVEGQGRGVGQQRGAEGRRQQALCCSRNHRSAF